MSTFIVIHKKEFDDETDPILGRGLAVESGFSTREAAESAAERANQERTDRERREHYQRVVDQHLPDAQFALARAKHAEEGGFAYEGEVEDLQRSVDHFREQIAEYEARPAVTPRDWRIWYRVVEIPVDVC